MRSDNLISHYRIVGSAILVLVAVGAVIIAAVTWNMTSLEKEVLIPSLWINGAMELIGGALTFLVLVLYGMEGRREHIPTTPVGTLPTPDIQVEVIEPNEGEILLPPDINERLIGTLTVLLQSNKIDFRSLDVFISNKLLTTKQKLQLRTEVQTRRR